MALKDWKKVERSFIIPKGTYENKPKPIIYEYKGYVVLEGAGIHPALVIATNWKGDYLFMVYAPKGAFKKFRIRDFRKLFKTKAQALKFAKEYMKKH